VLLIMSILSWYYILSKAWSSWRIRKAQRRSTVSGKRRH